MTDEEIVKDLTKLSLYTGLQEKYIQALNAALDLIIHQKTEIDRLKEWENLLKAEKHSLIKSEAIKEFAKRG